MDLKFKIVKMDKRHTGYPSWKFYVKTNVWYDTSDTNRDLFYDWKFWCWEIWGPARSIDEYDTDDLMINNHNVWSWDINKQRSVNEARRIYFMTEKELSAFVLKWS